MVESVAERLARLEKAHQEVDDIVLGRWDLLSGKRHKGIAEKLDQVAEQVAVIVKILKWGIGPLVTLCAVEAVGGSVKEILPTAAKVLVSIIGLK